MKNYMILIIILALAVTLPACASFECSLGVGYRKVPPEVSQPILSSRADMKALGLSPAEIKLLFDFLLSDSFKVLFPATNRVDLGGWVEIRAK